MQAAWRTQGVEGLLPERPALAMGGRETTAPVVSLSQYDLEARIYLVMTPLIPQTRGRKRHLNLEIVGLEGPLGAPPPWERQLIEPALAKVLDPKQEKTEEARDATAP